MSTKIIISEKMLGPNFVNVVLNHVTYLAKKNNLNINEIQKELNKSKSGEDFIDIIHRHFSNEIKLIL